MLFQWQLGSYLFTRKTDNGSCDGLAVSVWTCIEELNQY